MSSTPSPRKVSAFTTILVMLVLMTIGAGITPLLNLQYTPGEKTKSIGISFTWQDASAKVVEQEVTAKIEGMVAGLQGIKELSSVSSKGGGQISIVFKKNVDMSAARFELSSLIRQVYPRLPDGVSYPYLSLSASGEAAQPILSYVFNANLSPLEIQHYVDRHIINKVSKIEGINSVPLTGANPFYYEVLYDPEKTRIYGLTAADITRAIQIRFGEDAVLGSAEESMEDEGPRRQILVKMGQAGDQKDFESIPIKVVQGRQIVLHELASVHYKEQKPNSYFRINGLNTINMTVYPEKGVNTLRVAGQVKSLMKSLEKEFPPNFAAMLGFDRSRDIVKELNKIYYRTILSMLILLLCVFVVSRSWRYLGIIIITMIANVLIAFIFFYFLDVDIHIYSMAGLTVSLGMIIDASIMMIDHYGYYRDRKVFISIFSALVTTIGALVVVFLLPEQIRMTLADFSMVMIICLSVSLAIAYLCIPVLVDRYPIRRKDEMLTAKQRAARFRHRRLQVRLTALHIKAVVKMRRWRWAFLVVGILGFGLPIHWLPASLKDDKGQVRKEGLANVYNKTIGGTWYQSKGKQILEPALGGSLRMFVKNKGGFGYREPARPQINIRAYMPEGSTAQQMNAVMQSMENYLSRYPEIEMYTMNARAREGSIYVTFKPEVEHTGLPLMIRGDIIHMATIYGAATWYVGGIIPESFSNNIYASEGYNYNILFEGYNYDWLYAYASASAERIRENRRVSKSMVFGGTRNSYGGQSSLNTEFFIDYNLERIAHGELSLGAYYSYLQQQLLENRIARLYDKGNMTEIRLVSSQKEPFDIWHVENSMIEIGGRSMKLSDIGSVEKGILGSNIHKRNQQYVMRMAFDFIGTNTLAERVQKREVDTLATLLPVGFKAEATSGWGYWDAGDKTQYALLLLIIVIIYLISSILFESLRQPLIIIMLIPLSFVGVFLIFPLLNFHFDQGGFASMVLLCGIVVNAGIYFINEFNLLQGKWKSVAPQGLTPQQWKRQQIRIYVKAFNHKVVPISLTVFSTIFGLIPFLLEGSKEVFWFSFAIGAMGGTFFSFMALLVYLPTFLPLGKNA